ncbi:type VII secretion protein EccCa [Phycicoccus avicenniae]|uniref:type VII secretion protein EccCa n=1 Tax=Phycicoccus avicenniae TaxID=2828860 RepID=UPI003D2C20E0
MSVRLVHRAARTTASPPGPSAHVVERPPVMPEGRGGLQGLLTLVPLLGAGASMTVMMLFRGSGLAAVGALMMVVTLLASVVMVVSQRGKATRARVRRREAYLGYLERTRSGLRDGEDALVEAAREADPHPALLLPLVREGTRLWERRRGDADFLAVRLGTGSVRVREFTRQGDTDALTETDEFMHGELELLEGRFSTLDELPVRVPLDGVGSVSVVGDAEFRQRVARILVAQAATFVSPEDLHLAAAVAPARRGRWDWLAWLPHLADQRHTTPLGPLRRLAPDVVTLDRMLREDLRRRLGRAAEARRNYLSGDRAGREPTLVVLLDVDEDSRVITLGDREHGAADLGVTLVHLVDDRRQEPEDVRLRILQSGEDPDRAEVHHYERRDAPPSRRAVVLDDWSVSECDTLTRHLAGLRLSPDSLEHDVSTRTNAITGLLDVEDPERLDLDRLWGPRTRTSFLRVPIGTDDQGEPVMLDLKEAAQFGMGPHGLCVGATGSGKSELLRMLVLALLASHGPDDLAMVLVDYKGGATFAPFADAPQVSGVITNLSDDATLVERVYASLSGEVERRQQVLKDAGNLADVTAYRRLRRERAQAGESLPPLPHLLVVIDEFGELLTARPDFIELFLSIGRIGRSIGVHLLLSSQRIEGGKLRGLDTYLSYRIGLRTLSEAESRTILDTPDAFSLPALPGYGYLKVDTTIYSRFRSGYVSGPLPEEQEDVDVAPQVLPVPAYGTPVDEDEVGVARPPEDDGDGDEGPSGPTLLGTMVGQIARRPATGQAVWLPPLPAQLTLDDVAGRPSATSAGARIPHAGHLRVPMGLLDDPRRQAQAAWEIDLSAAGGHVLVVGGPRTGRTTVLRTLAASLALTHSPLDAVVFGVDLLGSSLQALDALPNVAGIGVRSDPEVVRRTVEEVSAVLAAREQLFHELRLDGLPAARVAQREGRVPDGVMLADVVLLVDGYGQLAEEFEEVERLLQQVVRRGAGLGLHVVATVSRWNEVRLAQQSFFGTKLELRLGDPTESAVGRALSETLRDAPPGRVLLPTALFAQVALPRVDGRADRVSAAEGLAELVALARDTAVGTAQRVRLLPPVVPASALERAGRRGLVPLGLSESTLETVALDLEGLDRHVVAIGDADRSDLDAAARHPDAGGAVRAGRARLRGGRPAPRPQGRGARGLPRGVRRVLDDGRAARRGPRPGADVPGPARR